MVWMGTIIIILFLTGLTSLIIYMLIGVRQQSPRFWDSDDDWKAYSEDYDDEE